MSFFGRSFNIFARKRHQGFTLVGGLISAAMMGGLALLLANLSKQQHIAQKATETHFEVTALFNLIVRALYDGEACNRTLVIGQSVSNGRNIDFIRNKRGGVVVNTTDKYGNGLLRIDSMRLKNVRLTGTSGEVDLEVVFLKLSTAIKGYNKATKVFPLSVEVDLSGNLVKCHHTIENLLQIVTEVMNGHMVPIIDSKADALRQELCAPLGADYDAVAKKCTLAGSPSPGESEEEDSEESSVPQHPITSNPIPFASPLDSTCSSRYECVETVPSDLTEVINVCPQGEAGTTLSNGLYHVAMPCYGDTVSDPIVAGSSLSSCVAAKNNAIALADPSNLASQMAGLGFVGRVICDSDCDPSGPPIYTMRCRLQRRFHTIQCTYTGCLSTAMGFLYEVF